MSTPLFNNTVEVEEYFCAPKYEYVNDDYAKGDKMCNFPYVPKGWGEDGESGFDDVDLHGDCSITYAESTGGQYGMMCMLYAILSVVPLLVTTKFYTVYRVKRLASKKKDVFSLAEKNCLLAIAAGICNVVPKIDSWGYAGVGGLAGYCTFATMHSMCTPFFLCIVIGLVRSWM